MTLPKNLLAEAENEAKIHQKRIEELDAFLGNVTPGLIAYHKFIAGWSACFTRLCELSEGEFDESAIAEQAGFHSLDIKELHGTECPALLEYAKRIARHQHSLDMAALLRQREEIARLKELRENTERLNASKHEQLAAERARAERLEKRHCGRLQKTLTTFRLMKSHALRWQRGSDGRD